jgi:hypothetical protein
MKRFAIVFAALCAAVVGVQLTPAPGSASVKQQCPPTGCPVVNPGTLQQQAVSPSPSPTAAATLPPINAACNYTMLSYSGGMIPVRLSKHAATSITVFYVVPASGSDPLFALTKSGAQSASMTLMDMARPTCALTVHPATVQPFAAAKPGVTEAVTISSTP